MADIVNYEPQNLWRHFKEITTLMHDSSLEDDVRTYVNQTLVKNPKITVSYYDEKQTNPKDPDDKDYVGKRVIVARKKADRGYEDQPTITLQAHTDMVCVPSNQIFPLQLLTYDEEGKTWLKAGAPPKQNGTTLGADDGIGVATILALIEDEAFPCGEIECFFTVQEETNMGGAAGFDINILKGRVYLNLDAEDITTIIYGSAGGALSTFTKVIHKETLLPGYVCVSAEISGLQGGHSGVNINEERANANCLISRFLYEAAHNKNIDFRLVDFSGGTKTNAIPSQAQTMIAVHENAYDALAAFFDEYIAGVRTDYINEPGLKSSFQKSGDASKTYSFNSEATLETLNLLMSLPHGVLKMYTDPDRKGIVESSTNLAIISVSFGDKIELTVKSSHRSSNDSSMAWVIGLHQAIAAANGVKYVLSDQYPTWNPNKDSKLLATAKDVYKVYEPDFTANIIHAGLETAYMVQKCPEMDCISIGPTVRNPHSSEESIRIDTVKTFYDIVKDIIIKYYGEKS